MTPAVTSPGAPNAPVAGTQAAQQAPWGLAQPPPAQVQAQAQAQAPQPLPTPRMPISPAPAPPVAISQNGAIDPRLAALGFELPSAFIQPRIIIDLSGHTKTGTTRTALSGPMPVFYYAFDPEGVKGVVEEFVRAGKVVTVRDFSYPLNANQDTYQRAYGEFLRALDGVTALYQRGTLVIDTGAEMEQLVRLSLFGKLKGVGTFRYEDRNAELEAIFNRCAKSSLTIVFIHKMRKTWQATTGAGGESRNAWTGGWEPDRPEVLERRVQINAMAIRESLPQGKYGGYQLYIQTCRLASQLAGMTYPVPWGSMTTLPKLMAEIFVRDEREFY